MGYKNNLHANDQQYSTFFSCISLICSNLRKKNVPWRMESLPTKKIWTQTSHSPYRTHTHTQNKQTILLNNCNILPTKRAHTAFIQHKKKPQLHHIKLHQLLHFPYWCASYIYCRRNLSLAQCTHTQNNSNNHDCIKYNIVIIACPCPKNEPKCISNEKRKIIIEF